jgi:glycosyltransferase involved in cell wall biosynthesis
MDKISIIVPCYNEEEALPLFLERTDSVIDRISDIQTEYLFVDDGSSDKTLDILRSWSAKREDIHYLSFSRNFGKEAAMLAGLEHSTGTYTVIMDADLQDPPEMIVDMYDILSKDMTIDCVAAKRVNRDGEPPVRSFFADAFYRIINKLSQTEIVNGARDFRMMRSRMVKAILSLPEKNRFSKGIFSWVGFNTKWLSYKNIERAAGKTKWSFWKLFLYSLEGITAFSTTPLSLAAFIGVLMCIIAVIAIVFVIVRQLLFGGSAFGWPSLVCIMLFVGGIQLFCLGIIGKYLAKTYTEVKSRPIYILAETEKGKQ